MSRTVTLVLVDAAGTLLGALPPYEVATPWWQDAADVLAGAQERYGVDVTVLRLLSTQRPYPHGGAVTYLAEYGGGPAGLVPVGLVQVELAEHPLRTAWARPGGPAASVSWAAKELAALGWGAVVASQQRAWNLSTIWRLDADAATAWLKQVPPFFAHEPAVLRWLATVTPECVPRLLATADPGRMLLAHAPGEDRYDAPPAEVAALLDDLHGIQRHASAHVEGLLALGVPDGRWPELARRVRGTAARHGADLGRPLQELLDGLADRFAAIDACGLPDTLVHGDFHPGNARGDGVGRTVIDWGDSFVGHPGFDVLRVVETQPPEVAARLLAHWAERWRAAVPGSAPDRAIALLGPVASLRAAAVYDDFVRNVEPSERPFHAGDVGFWLRHAVTG